MRWAILGTGKIANRFACALKNLPEQADLFAVGSRRVETGESFAASYGIPKIYEGYDEVVADPEVEIVYIGTPGVFHHRDITASLNSGKHVLCEKVLTMNAAEARDVIALARRKKLFLMEAMWTRFFPVHIHVRELLSENAIGELRGLMAPFIATAPPDPKNRFHDIELGAGVLLDLGSYGISWAYSLFGSPEEAMGLASFGETGADYQSACILRFGEGQIATVSTSMISYDVKDAVVYGTTGKILIHDPWYKPTAVTLYREGNSYNGYEYEATAVMDCIRQGRTECETMLLDESLAIIQTLDDIRKQWNFVYPFEQARNDV
jgi:predicted dehydrogenase